MEYRQTKIAYIVNYILWKWLLALCLFFLPVVYDFFKYTRNSLMLGQKSLTHKFGVITQNSRDIPYKSIQSVNVDQSVLGQMFNYGNIVIFTANSNDSIVFQNVSSPQTLKHAIQNKI